MIKRNFIKTIVGSSAALLFPFKSLANKSDSYEDIAANIIRWLQNTKHKLLLDNKDTCQLINAIHNNDEVYAYRGLGKTFCIILLAAYQSIKENKRVLVISETRRQDKLIEKELSKLGFMNSNILFAKYNNGRYLMSECVPDVCYCEGLHFYEIFYPSFKAMSHIKSLKKVAGREDKLEITVFKNGVRKDYAPSLHLEMCMSDIANRLNCKITLSKAARWC